MQRGRVGPPRDGVAVVEVDGRVSVYSPELQQLLALNETASDIWHLCDGEHDREGIVGLLAAAYEVQPDLIAEDVRAVLRDLVRYRLLPETPGL